nr:putative ribonuclease H-like domain-containing protein [Tanacetum cinerariifolium]
STNPHNYDGDAAFDEKEHDFDAKKPESLQAVVLNQENKMTRPRKRLKERVLSNAVNAAGSIVLTIRQNSFKNTNTFSAADMPELEDITYSNDEDVVAAEADFNNLESSIPEEPKRVHEALKDPSWIEAMQEELLQFNMQKVWVLVDLPHGKRA